MNAFAYADRYPAPDTPPALRKPVSYSEAVERTRQKMRSSEDKTRFDDREPRFSVQR